MATVGDRLAALLAMQKIELSDGQVAQLVWLVQELLRWNRSRNLTAITQLDEILEKHIIDALTLLPFARSSRRMLDIGSGAGFPALPLKVACPQLEVVSVDAVAKKISFQKHAVRSLGLEGFTALHGRVEELGASSAFEGGFDLVTARAVGKLTLLAELAAPCLAAGGHLVAMKGPEGTNELEEYRDELKAQGWATRHELLQLPESGAQRCLLILTRERGLKRNM
jgi:16S rRNA (guanine527-N7)-methyltransferase